MQIFIEYAITFGWAVTASLSMALALGIGLKVYDFLTPIDEWEEIRKGNIAMAIIMVSVIAAFAFAIVLTINTFG